GTQFPLEDLGNCESGIETYVVEGGDRPHLVAEANCGLVRVLAAHDTFFHHFHCLVQERHEHPVDAESCLILSQDRLFAELATELNHALKCLVGGEKAPDQLATGLDRNRI